jgi:hypothetical protein
MTHQKFEGERTLMRIHIGESNISNNAGSCQDLFLIFCSLFSFFGHTTPFTPKSGLSCSVKLCFDDHGSFVISRSVSVRPKHLCDPYFDHDY